MRPCLNNFYYLQYTTQVFNALILLEGVWFLQRLSADHITQKGLLIILLKFATYNIVLD